MKIDKNKVRSFRIGLFGFLFMGSIISVPVRVTAVTPVHSTVASQSGIVTVAAQPIAMQQVTQQPVSTSQVVSQVASAPVSDELFLQNTANKLIAEKLNVLKVKLERYKKYIISNANELTPKIQKLFGV